METSFSFYWGEGVPRLGGVGLSTAGGGGEGLAAAGGGCEGLRMSSGGGDKLVVSGGDCEGLSSGGGGEGLASSEGGELTTASEAHLTQYGTPVGTDGPAYRGKVAKVGCQEEKKLQVLECRSLQCQAQMKCSYLNRAKQRKQSQGNFYV